MRDLLDAITNLVSLISPDKAQALAIRIRKIKEGTSKTSLSDAVGTPMAKAVLDQLINTWQATSISSDELASMLLAASHTFESVTRHQSIELVWTGPTTPFVSARRTEQALLQVINVAKETLFITSFVAHDVMTIVDGLNEASNRGVEISMLLESSQDHGGSISFDAIAKMRTLVPSAKLYAWMKKDPPFANGRVHAKVAVADGDACFITSANLTGHAMEQNMEAGVLISHGFVPEVLRDHLQSLVDMTIVVKV
ncbi:phospholipase [Dyella monticola]|uniref:Phospholipase n=1 Tax=Dyella monticola TaxID=1927958 RepID=A0A370X203_9GAMM|nr:DISARM system phospholipase D-like protein DrmC [Dyella monticola]RDS82245.1 phospholipase [Dyella monticola]